MTVKDFKQQNFKSITLIKAPGKGASVVEELFKAGVPMADLHRARGASIGGPVKRNGVPIEGEQEVVTCVVEAHRADEIFALIFDIAEVDRPGGGFMYMQAVDQSTVMVVPRDSTL